MSDRGSSAAELVVITPLLMALIGVFVFAGRLVLARQDVDDAARTALDAAVTMPDATGANTMAGITAYLTLAPDDTLCSDGRTTLDTSDFAPGGIASVQVSCVISMPRLAFAGVPSSVVVTATRSGPIEPYREMQP
ncbi:MAG: TadE/TadG family type IV pilus assembly protein [Acidimicrobiales bacterium]